MNSITIIEAANTISLPFNGQHIITAMASGIAYVAMKPIVENLGLSWGTQQQKLMRQMDKFNCIHMNMVAVDSKFRQLLCIPLKKLNGWLFSINPEKVRADIRDRLIRYQEECFTALHDYWTKGAAVRQPDSTVDERTPLRGIVNRIMGKYGMTFQAVYKLVHQEFGVQRIDELSPKQTSEAIEYLAGKVIEGEFIGRSAEIKSKGTYNFPVETADPHDRAFGNAWMTPRVILDERNRAPELELLDLLEKDGYDISGARIRIHAMYGITQQFIEMQKQLSQASRYLSSLNDIIRNQTVQRGDNVSFTGGDKGLPYGGFKKRELN